MTEITFIAPEYQPDRTFRSTHYAFRGGPAVGWTVLREGETWLSLGPGYEALPTRYCGICATDLARHQLPFALPQITGHEVVAEYAGKPSVVEINASHIAIGHAVADCPWCRSGNDIHCPARLTLGIDRLPGGFAPWVLAPVNGIHTLPASLEPIAGVLIEPFAAALKAVEVSRPEPGDEVAVLGPRRLGMLLLAALAAHRRQANGSYTITAVVRHAHLASTCRRVGADKVLVIDAETKPTQQFDIVYDTTGKVAGFESALALSRGTVHLKSTHGQVVQGLHHLTDMVINEQALQGWNTHSAQDALAREKSVSLYVSPRVPAAHFQSTAAGIYQGEAADMLRKLQQDQQAAADTVLPLFDAALVSSPAEADEVLRCRAVPGGTLIKPLGTIYMLPDKEQTDTALGVALHQRGIRIAGSRCGSFRRAIDLLERDRQTALLLNECFISHEFPLGEIGGAFELAADSRESNKVVISTGR
ncbi:MAG: alcohol dehydrogenase catalytic domain-containing protein [Gammaproteobacteria bacterium]|nr:alcohol dehydrogenase catalytic domain-containing protein [Gammaproteobacteria bacterium]